MLTKPKKVLSIPDLTKDQIAKSALSELRANGARVRKVHNVSAYKKRRGQVEAGWPDIQGYSKTGVAILCEVKTKGDIMSEAQIQRLDDLKKCGGISLLAIQIGYQTEIIKWEDAKMYFS